MKSLWIVAFLVAACGVYARAQLDDEYDNYFNYDDLDDLDQVIEDEEINERINKDTDNENDLKVKEEIQEFREADGEQLDPVDDPKDTIDNIDDYQFEDNRDKFKEEQNDDKKELPVDNDNSFDNSVEDAGLNNLENRPEPDDPNAPPRNEDYALLWGDDNVAPLPVPEIGEDENKAIIEKTKQILAEQDGNNLEEEIKDLLEKAHIINPDETGGDINAVVEETKQILANMDGDNLEQEIKDIVGDVIPDETADKSILEETKQILADEADNFEEEIKKVIEKADENADEKSNLEQIVEETKQLLAESDNSFNNDKTNLEKDVVKTNDEEKENVETKVGQEEKEEDTVDKVYADLNADLDKLFETLDKLKNNDSDNDEDIDKALEDADKLFEDLDNKDEEGSDELDENNKYEDIDLDKLLENILSEVDMKAEDTAAEVLEPMLNDALNEPNPDDAIEKDVESLDSKLQPIRYFNDALVNEPKENAEPLENLDENDANEVLKDASIEKKPVKSTFVDELNSSELEDLVDQFAILHSEDLDVHSENFNKDVAPVHITLKLDEPTVITSPNYDSPYPTGNIVDWILEGPGKGIELNITDFAVNGAMGDYLLIKPGGVDETDHEGLLFTYRLTSERRYRFMDVDSLFLRFESEPSMMPFRGFSLSARMIAPLPSEPEPIPEPEAVVTPHSTATVTLEVPVPEFREVEEQFQQILADMAAEYIRDNDVDPGLNTTSEVTRITAVDLCPMAWPGYEGCTAVTFGVSLQYEEEDIPRLDQEDLRSMWTTYVNRDPFALRLRALGLSEFSGPNSAAMTAWLVIAGGVVISMAMLAFVLWRYSCFEGYTRMQPYSDTDSAHNEKRALDLYPTPHQTLPPLYADTQHQYKWEDDTRVDMGGFANRSYTRENMYDFESDEEVVSTRDRQGVVTAKDYSSNV